MPQSVQNLSSTVSPQLQEPSDTPSTNEKNIIYIPVKNVMNVMKNIFSYTIIPLTNFISYIFRNVSSLVIENQKPVENQTPIETTQQVDSHNGISNQFEAQAAVIQDPPKPKSEEVRSGLTRNQRKRLSKQKRNGGSNQFEAQVEVMQDPPKPKSEEISSELTKNKKTRLRKQKQNVELNQFEAQAAVIQDLPKPKSEEMKSELTKNQTPVENQIPIETPHQSDSHNEISNQFETQVEVMQDLGGKLAIGNSNSDLSEDTEDSVGEWQLVQYNKKPMEDKKTQTRDREKLSDTQLSDEVISRRWNNLICLWQQYSLKELLEESIYLYHQNPNLNPIDKLQHILKFVTLRRSIYEDKKAEIIGYIDKLYSLLKDRRRLFGVRDSLKKRAFEYLFKAALLFDEIKKAEEIFNYIKGKVDHQVLVSLKKLLADRRYDIEAEKKIEQIDKNNIEAQINVYLELVRTKTQANTLNKPLLIIRKLLLNINSYHSEFKEIFKKVIEVLGSTIAHCNRIKQYDKAGAIVFGLSKIYYMSGDLSLSTQVISDQEKLEMQQTEGYCGFVENISLNVYIIYNIDRKNRDSARDKLREFIAHKYGNNIPEEHPTGNIKVDSLKMELYDYSKCKKLYENMIIRYYSNKKLKTTINIIMLKQALKNKDHKTAQNLSVELYCDEKKIDKEDIKFEDIKEFTGDEKLDTLIIMSATPNTEQVKDMLAHINFVNDDIFDVATETKNILTLIETLKRLREKTAGREISPTELSGRYDFDIIYLKLLVRVRASEGEKFSKDDSRNINELKDKLIKDSVSNLTKAQQEELYFISAEYYSAKSDYNGTLQILTDELLVIDHPKSKYIAMYFNCLKSDNNWNGINKAWKKYKEYYKGKINVLNAYAKGVLSYVEDEASSIEKLDKAKIEGLDKLLAELEYLLDSKLSLLYIHNHIEKAKLCILQEQVYTLLDKQVQITQLKGRYGDYQKERSLCNHDNLKEKVINAVNNLKKARQKFFIG